LYTFLVKVFWLGLFIRNYISETRKRIEMPSKEVSVGSNGKISCRAKRSTSQNIMFSIHKRKREIFVIRVYCEVLIWIDSRLKKLPTISNNIVKISMFEHVDWTRREPIFQINIPSLLVFPSVLLFFEFSPDCKILIFTLKTNVFSLFLRFPVAESPCL
jgi:hypothetical protein